MRHRVLLLLVVVMAAPCLSGCRQFVSMWFEPATLYADTLTAEKDGFTNRGPQWAYEGEPVTFDFAPDPAASDYAVFIWPGGTPDVLTNQQLVNTYFRGIGVFKAGREPRKNLIQAFAYSIQGDCDWYHDGDADKWVHHLTRADEADFEVGRAQMEIICYRAEIDIAFRARDRQVKDIVLRLIRDDDSRTLRRVKTAADEPGFDLLGPDDRGEYRVRYTPIWKEVNRVGTTDVELVLTYDDGTQETIARTIDTP